MLAGPGWQVAGATGASRWLTAAHTGIRAKNGDFAFILSFEWVVDLNWARRYKPMLHCDRLG